MRPAHTPAAYLFRADRDAHTEIELAFVHQREEWQQRSRHDQGGWTDPVVVDPSVPADEGDAERIAQGWVG